MVAAAKPVPVIHIDGDDDSDEVVPLAAEADSPQTVAMDDAPVCCYLKLL